MIERHGTPRVTVRSLHISFGVMLAVLLAFRLAGRRRRRARSRAPGPDLGQFRFG
jgi:cytochrome b561